jgi:hypothetical protein
MRIVFSFLGITLTSTWNEARPFIASDPRFERFGADEEYVSCFGGLKVFGSTTRPGVLSVGSAKKNTSRMQPSELPKQSPNS